jgi:capsular polysaccharide export protein
MRPGADAQERFTEAPHYVVPAEAAARPFWLPPHGARLAVLSAIARRFPFIADFLDIALMPIGLASGPVDGMIGWGHRLPARLTHAYATLRGLPFWSLEDGFFRSVGLGRDGVWPISIIADDLGAHFSPVRPSRLEILLNEVGDNSRGMAAPKRARDLRDFIVRERLTKWNHLPDRPIDAGPGGRRRILLIDQVRGDGAVWPDGAAAFQRMWCEAVTQDDAEIIVKAHPVAGAASGHLGALARAHGARLITHAVSPHAVLDVADEVWTVSSQFGLDALLREKKVVTFGVPAYAGWGLTDDRARTAVAHAAFARRSRRLTIDDYVDAALIRYPIYFDPVARRLLSAEAAMQRLVTWRRRSLAWPGTSLCCGFSRHKRKVVADYLRRAGSRVSFSGSRPSARKVAAADRIVVWGDGASHLPSWIGGKPLLHAEDGFIRSVGLGSDHAEPSSLCFDAQAPYFDALHESGLERLLNSATFDRALLDRAARLRNRILTLEITKYNLQTGSRPDYRTLAGGRQIIVVAGQVPGDASLRFGLPLHGSNLSLLAAVRVARSDCFIVYKEHPDLLAGNRKGRTAEVELRRHADLVVGAAAVDPLLLAADEVHVATSQLGFEAVLRRCRVFCHGVPFYGGWGLTDDLVAPPRPRRKLGLNDLAAGVLILYPHYLSRRTGSPCEAEDVIAEFGGARWGAALLQQALAAPRP